MSCSPAADATRFPRIGRASLRVRKTLLSVFLDVCASPSGVAIGFAVETSGLNPCVGIGLDAPNRFIRSEVAGSGAESFETGAVACSTVAAAKGISPTSGNASSNSPNWWVPGVVGLGSRAARLESPKSRYGIGDAPHAASARFTSFLESSAIFQSSSIGLAP
jgi:hypothetical protein